jgi:hypothetical protein
MDHRTTKQRVGQHALEPFRQRLRVRRRHQQTGTIP